MVDAYLSICLNTTMKIMNRDQATTISDQEERLVFLMQLLGDKTRYKMFKLLLTRDGLCVSQIADELHVTTSAISQHFRQFEMIGLVDKNRDGQRLCYALRNDDLLVRKLTNIIMKGNE